MCCESQLSQFASWSRVRGGVNLDTVLWFTVGHGLGIPIRGMDIGPKNVYSSDWAFESESKQCEHVLNSTM